MNSGDQFRSGPPPALGSPEYAAALAEVMTVGSSTASLAERSAFQTLSAQYWATAAGTGLAPWINAAIGAADGQNFTSLEYAAMFALLSTNVADAVIGVFDAKYFYDFWRPVMAIPRRRSGFDLGVAHHRAIPPFIHFRTFRRWRGRGGVADVFLG